MERLLDDAEKIKAKYGETAEYSVDNLADIVEAIHVVQKEQEISGYTLDEIKQKIKDKSLTEQEVARIAQDLYKDDADGIQKVMKALEEGTLTANDALILTGTTSLEANSTIEGSLRSMGAAWENWLISIANTDPEQFEKATDDLIDRVAIAMSNIIPRVAVILANLATFIGERAPTLFEELKTAFFEALPDDEARNKFGEYFEMVSGAIDAVGGALDMMQGAASVISEIISYVIGNWDSIAGTLSSVGDGLSTVGDFFTWLGENKEMIAGAIGAATGGFVAFNAALGILSAGPIPLVVGAIAALVAAIVTAYNTNEDFRNKVNEVWEGFKNAVSIAGEVIGPILENIGNIVIGLKDTVSEKIEEIVGFFSGLPERIQSYFEHPELLLHDIGVQIIKGLTGGLIQDPDAVLNSLSTLVDNGVGWFKDFFGISSPSKLMSQYGNYIAEGLANGIDEGASGPEAAIQNAANSMYGSLDNATDNASNSFNNAIVQLMGYFNDLANSSDTEIGNVVRYFGAMPNGIVQGIGDVSHLLYSVGMYLIEGLTTGIASNVYSVMDVLLGGVMEAVRTVKVWLGIASPSKRMAEIGDYMMQGWTKGIEDEQDSTEKAMLNAAQSIYGAASGEVSANGLGVGAGGILAGGGVSIQVAELVVREEADIDRIAEQLYLKIRREQEAHGWSTSFTMALT